MARESIKIMSGAQATTDDDMFAEFPLRSGRVAIVGFATESMYDAPWDDQDVEFWILNMLHSNVPRWDRLWELHDRACVEQESEEKEEQRKAERGGHRHIDALIAERRRPIYTTEPWPDVPMSRRFPIETFTAWLGPLCDKIPEGYYTSTFAYMIAAAVRGIVARREHPFRPKLDEGIYVAGVEMLNGSEYAYERSCAEFWCGFVLGHGIPLHIPKRSALLESDGLYGYAHANESLVLLSRTRAYYEDRKKNFLDMAAAAKRRFNQARADWNTHDGARQALDLVLEEADLTDAQRKRFAEYRGLMLRRRDEAEALREKSEKERVLATGAAQGVDFAISHTIYLSRGGKV